jgi:hypothetical protein
MDQNLLGCRANLFAGEADIRTASTYSAQEPRR